MHRFASLVLGVVAAAALSAGANAADVTRSVIVGRAAVFYGDLNLSTAQGAATLHARISSAAAQTCGGAPQFVTSFSYAPRYTTMEFERCRTAAIRTAIADVRHQVVAVAD